MKSKILQINAIYGKGSTGLIVKDIDQLLQENDYSSYVAAAYFHDVCNNSYIIGNRFDHKIHAMLTRISGKQAYNSLIATKKLLNWIDKIQPDIVHLHNLHSNYINLNMLISHLIKRNIDTVITLHDCWFFTGKCFHFFAVGCQRWKTGCGKCPLKKSYVPSYFFDASHSVFLDKNKYLNQMTKLTVIGVSKWITGLAKQSLLSSKDIRCIYNGINNEVFSINLEERKIYREKFGVSDSYVILGMADKWLNKSTLSTFSYITKRLSESMILFLLGCNESQRMNLPKNVIAVNFINDRRELAFFYNLADVFVNVTQEDSLPTVNMESMACGTPVITYDSGGSSELITAQTGEVVPYNDYKNLWKSICKMRERDQNKLRMTCRKYSEKHFNFKECYNKYIDLYTEIIERERKSK
jgi:glycosyltransferase involved in cell wall biosynthesis